MKPRSLFAAPFVGLFKASPSKLLIYSSVLIVAALCLCFATFARSQGDPAQCKKLQAAGERLQKQLEDLEANLDSEECQGLGKKICQARITAVKTEIQSNGQKAEVACQPIPTPEPLTDGDVIKRSTGEVFLIENGRRRHVPDSSLNAYGLVDPVQLPDARIDRIPAGPDLPSVSTSFIRRSTGETYHLESGKRRLIPSENTLAKRFPGADVRTISDSDVDSISLGSDIPRFESTVAAVPDVLGTFNGSRKSIQTPDNLPITIETDVNGEITDARYTTHEGIKRHLTVAGAPPARTLTLFENDQEILFEGTDWDWKTATGFITVGSKKRRAWIFYEFELPWGRDANGKPMLIGTTTRQLTVNIEDFPEDNLNLPSRKRTMTCLIHPNGRVNNVKLSAGTQVEDYALEANFRGELNKLSTFNSVIEQEVAAYQAVQKQFAGAPGFIVVRASLKKIVLHAVVGCTAGAAVASPKDKPLGCAVGAIAAIANDVGDALIEMLEVDSTTPEAPASSGGGFDAGVPGGIPTSGDSPPTKKTEAETDSGGDKPKRP